jgi:hypothetical protein
MQSAVLLLAGVKLLNIDKQRTLCISCYSSSIVDCFNNLYLLFLHDPQLLSQSGEPVLVLVPGQLHPLSKQATNISQN